VATVPSPRTWAVGELLTAAKLNTDLRDGLNLLLAPPMAVLRRSATQSIATGGSGTAVDWTVEDLDRDNGHSLVTNISRYTAQTAGWYDLTVGIAWSGGDTSQSNRLAWFRKNGAAGQLYSDFRGASLSNGMAAHSLKGCFFLAVNDYVEVFVQQFGGGTLTMFVTSTDGGPLVVKWIST
jgi:hypothetical protein